MANNPLDQYTDAQLKKYQKLMNVMGFIFMLLSFTRVWLFPGIGILFMLMGNTYRKELKARKTGNRFINEPISNLRENQTTQSDNPKIIVHLDGQRIIECYVAGAEFNEKAIKKVFRFLREDADVYEGLSNSEIKEYYSDGDKIWELGESDICNARLEREPDNEYDKNAIKVYAILEDEEIAVGYVPKKYNKKVLKNWEHISDVEIYPKGGKYKTIDYDMDKGKDVIITGEANYNLGLDIVFSKDIE